MAYRIPGKEMKHPISIALSQINIDYLDSKLSRGEIPSRSQFISELLFEDRQDKINKRGKYAEQQRVIE